MAGSVPAPVDDCIFCAIVAGRAPARIVHSDALTVAFLDIFPLTPGHALVVPRRHSRDLLDAAPEDVAAVTAAAREVAAASVSPSGLGADGFNLIQANGSVAFQTVFHLHIHVLPRYRGDGFRLPFERTAGDPAEMEEQAARYRAALGGG